MKRNVKSQEKANSIKWTVYGLTFASYALFHSIRSAWAGLKNMFYDPPFQYSIHFLGLMDMIVVFTLAIALSGFGHKVQKIGAKKVLIFGMAALAILIALIGAMVMQEVTSEWIYVILFGLGVGVLSATGWPSCLYLLSQYFDKKNNIALPIWNGTSQFGDFLALFISDMVIQAIEQNASITLLIIPGLMIIVLVLNIIYLPRDKKLQIHQIQQQAKDENQLNEQRSQNQGKQPKINDLEGKQVKKQQNMISTQQKLIGQKQQNFRKQQQIILQQQQIIAKQFVKLENNFNTIKSVNQQIHLKSVVYEKKLTWQIQNDNAIISDQIKVRVKDQRDSMKNLKDKTSDNNNEYQSQINQQYQTSSKQQSLRQHQLQQMSKQRQIKGIIKENVSQLVKSQIIAKIQPQAQQQQEYIDRRPVNYKNVWCLPGVALYVIAYAIIKSINSIIMTWLVFYLSLPQMDMKDQSRIIAILWTIGVFGGGVIGGKVNRDYSKLKFIIFLIICSAMFIMLEKMHEQIYQIQIAITIMVCSLAYGVPYNMLSTAVPIMLGQNPKIKHRPGAKTAIISLMQGFGQGICGISILLVPIIGVDDIHLVLTAYCFLAISVLAIASFYQKSFNKKTKRQDQQQQQNKKSTLHHKTSQYQAGTKSRIIPAKKENC